jgi:hypothetical protein
MERRPFYQGNDMAGLVIRGEVLVEAFRLAWLRALKSEMISADNIERAPAELMAEIILAAHDGNVDETTLAAMAFFRWRLDDMKTDEATPKAEFDCCH